MLSVLCGISKVFSLFPRARLGRGNRLTSWRNFVRIAPVHYEGTLHVHNWTIRSGASNRQGEKDPPLRSG